MGRGSFGRIYTGRTVIEDLFYHLGCYRKRTSGHELLRVSLGPRTEHLEVVVREVRPVTGF